MSRTKAGAGRFITLLAGLLAVTACGDSPFEIIEEEDFAASLEVDLAASTKTATGLYYRDLVVGDGDPAVAGDLVQVTYEGYLRTGSQFDAGEFSFTLGVDNLIDGFEQGIEGMRVGGRRQLIIPPELAYGDRDDLPAIPPGSILVFLVEVVSIS